MKELVKHTCGHEHTHDVYGKSSDREKKVAWLETTVCPDCYRAAQEAQATAGKTGEWIEMSYAQFKNEYADCQKKDYNAKTKTIFVFVEKSEEPAAEQAPATAKNTELKDSILATLDIIINGITTNAGFDPVKHAPVIEMWTTRRKKLADCFDNAFIADFFGAFKIFESEQETISGLLSIYKMQPNNGFDFK